MFPPRRQSGPDSIHGCPVERNRLSPTIHTQPKIPLAGLDPAIYVFPGLVISAAKTWIPGTSPGKAYSELHLGSRGSILHCPNCPTGQLWTDPANPRDDDG